MKALLCLAAVSLLGPLSPQDKAVPVEEEPNHKSVFKNDYVQAFRVTLQPGQNTLMHIHSHDDVAVRLSDATVAQEALGKPVGPPETVHPGIVTARDNETANLTHRVLNIGKTVFDVIDIQILQRPPGDLTDALMPPAAENPKMRAYRYELAPGASSAQHTHSRPYLILAATDLDLRMTAPDGTSMDHPIKAGDMHWVDSSVTHVLTNRGSQKGVIVEIELK